MPPQVININKAPKGWENDPAYIYIGRAGNGMRGTFGNPVVVGRACPVCDEHHDGPGNTLTCYEIYLRRRVDTDQTFKAQVKALKGKTLVCFCRPRPCHGTILAKVVEELTL